MDRYLSGRPATSLQTGQYMVKLRFVHKASVECPFAGDSTTLKFCRRRGKELYLLQTIGSKHNALTFMHGTLRRPTALR